MQTRSPRGSNQYHFTEEKNMKKNKKERSENCLRNRWVVVLVATLQIVSETTISGPEAVSCSMIQGNTENLNKQNSTIFCLQHQCADLVYRIN